MFGLIYFLLQIYVLVLIAYAVMSFFQPAPGSPVRTVQKGLGRVCDPVLNLVRRVIPPARVGGMGLDFSVLIVILVIEIVLLPLFA